MGSSVNDILAGAKKALSDADNKFSSSSAKIATSDTPNEYSHAPYSLVGAAKNALSKAASKVTTKLPDQGAEVAKSIKEKAENIKKAQ